MITQPALKQKLQEIAQAGFEPAPQDELRPLLAAMTAHIGALDPLLRDDLIFMVFRHWIGRDHLPAPLLRELFDAALDERHLFYAMGGGEPDAVFTRTFSLLLLACLLDSHRRRPFLKPGEVQHALRQTLSYAAQERDFRGYVEGKGWAHSAAHTADVLDELARCTELSSAEMAELLAGIGALAANPAGVYTHQEDERLSVAARAALECGRLPVETWLAWVDGFVALAKAPGEFPHSYYRKVNVKHFLRCCYFRMRGAELQVNAALQTALIGRIEQALGQITGVY